MQLSAPLRQLLLALVSFEHQRSFQSGAVADLADATAAPSLLPENEIAVILLCFFKNHFASKHVRTKKRRGETNRGRVSVSVVDRSSLMKRRDFFIPPLDSTSP